MTTAHPFARAFFCATLAASAVPAFAADETLAGSERGACAAHYSAMQERVIDRAAQGPDALRRYVGIIQPMHQIDYADAVAWLDGERGRLQACRTAALRNMTASR